MRGAIDCGLLSCCPEQCLAGSEAVDEGCDTIAEVCEATDVDRGACNTLDDGSKAIVEGCGDVDKGNVFAGNGVIDVGCEAMDGGNASAGIRAIDVGCEAVGGGHVFAGTCVVNVSREAVGGGDDLVNSLVVFPWMMVSGTGGKWVHGTSVMSSPSAVASTSPLTCSSTSPTFTLSFKSPNSLTSLT